MRMMRLVLSSLFYDFGFCDYLPRSDSITKIQGSAITRRPSSRSKPGRCRLGRIQLELLGHWSTAHYFSSWSYAPIYPNFQLFAQVKFQSSFRFYFCSGQNEWSITWIICGVEWWPLQSWLVECCQKQLKFFTTVSCRKFKRRLALELP